MEKSIKVKIINNVLKGKTYNQLIIGSIKELPESTARGWFINGLAVPFHPDITEEKIVIPVEKDEYKPEMTKKEVKKPVKRTKK